MYIFIGVSYVKWFCVSVLLWITRVPRGFPFKAVLAAYYNIHSRAGRAHTRASRQLSMAAHRKNTYGEDDVH